jgi:hypothetical protein
MVVSSKLLPKRRVGDFEAELRPDVVLPYEPHGGGFTLTRRLQLDERWQQTIRTAPSSSLGSPGTATAVEGDRWPPAGK